VVAGDWERRRARVAVRNRIEDVVRSDAVRVTPADQVDLPAQHGNAIEPRAVGTGGNAVQLSLSGS